MLFTIVVCGVYVCYVLLVLPNDVCCVLRCMTLVLRVCLICCVFFVVGCCLCVLCVVCAVLPNVGLCMFMSMFTHHCPFGIVCVGSFVVVS